MGHKLQDVDAYTEEKNWKIEEVKQGRNVEGKEE
jgi:hypothetical protein